MTAKFLAVLKGSPLGELARSDCGGDPSRENGVQKRPQAFLYPEIKNILSAIYAQSNAERISNRPALGGLHHKIR